MKAIGTILIVSMCLACAATKGARDVEKAEAGRAAAGKGEEPNSESVKRKGRVKPRLNRRRCRLADSDALVVQSDRSADNAAVTEVLLGAQQPVHLLRNQAPERKNRSVADVMRMTPRFLKIDPWPRVSFALQVRSAGAMKIVVELPAQNAVGIHHPGEPLACRILCLTVTISPILLAHHVHRLQS